MTIEAPRVVKDMPALKKGAQGQVVKDGACFLDSKNPLFTNEWRNEYEQGNRMAVGVDTGQKKALQTVEVDLASLNASCTPINPENKDLLKKERQSFCKSVSGNHFYRKAGYSRSYHKHGRLKPPDIQDIEDILKEERGGRFNAMHGSNVKDMLAYQHVYFSHYDTLSKYYNQPTFQKLRSTVRASGSSAKKKTANFIIGKYNRENNIEFACKDSNLERARFYKNGVLEAHFIGNRRMSYHFRKAQEVILKGVRLKMNEEGEEVTLRDFRYDWSNVIQLAMECAQKELKRKDIVKCICIPLNIPIDTSNLKKKNLIPPKNLLYW
jgi:hypothetical protein